MVYSTGNQQNYLIAILKENGASLIGFGDVAFLQTPLTDKYPTAISLAIRYNDSVIDTLHLDESAFYTHQISLNVLIIRLLDATENLLKNWGYNFNTIPISANIRNREQLKLLNTFPHKTAATSAGLGWIGKSSLLITPQYGPRVRLATVLTDAPFKAAEPIVADMCGKCSLCVKACPCHAIHNINWKKGIERETLLDAYKCNEYRLECISSLSRKSSCGLCIQACKIGRCP